MAMLLIALILAYSVPALVPILSKTKISPGYKMGVIAFALSSLLQIVFITFVDKHTLSLDNSLRFAAGGVPCCILALVAARKGNPLSGSRGAIVSASFGLAMWMFLITLH